MTLDAFIDEIIRREGAHYVEPPQSDQPTAAGGITASALAEDLGLPVSRITKEMLRSLTLDQARGVIRRRLMRQLDQFGLARIAFEPLRLQMLDFAYNSGTARAVRWLQRTVGLPSPVVTGILDERTRTALKRLPPILVNNALAAARAHAALNGGAPPKFAHGVALRAIDFVLTAPETSTVRPLENENKQTAGDDD